MDVRVAAELEAGHAAVAMVDPAAVLDRGGAEVLEAHAPRDLDLRGGGGQVGGRRVVVVLGVVTQGHEVLRFRPTAAPADPPLGRPPRREIGLRDALKGHWRAPGAEVGRPAPGSPPTCAGRGGSAWEGADAAVAGDVPALAVAGLGDDEARAIVGDGDRGRQPEAGERGFTVAQALLPGRAGQQAQAVLTDVVGPDDVVLDVRDRQQVAPSKATPPGVNSWTPAIARASWRLTSVLTMRTCRSTWRTAWLPVSATNRARRARSRDSERGPLKRALRQLALMMPGVPGVPAKISFATAATARTPMMCSAASQK